MDYPKKTGKFFVPIRVKRIIKYFKYLLTASLITVNYQSYSNEPVNPYNIFNPSINSLQNIFCNFVSWNKLLPHSPETEPVMDIHLTIYLMSHRKGQQSNNFSNYV